MNSRKYYGHPSKYSMFKAFSVTEISPEGEVFHSTDFTSKTAITTPTKTLRGEVVLQVTKVAKVAFRALNLCGLASFDMIVQVSWSEKL